MKNLSVILPILLLSAACTKVSFEPVPLTEQKQTTVTPPVVELPVFKAGECVNQESVAACLKCDNPPPPPPPPPEEPVSTKAQKLAKIMAMACQISNKSYPASYKAPSEAEVQAHLLACSPELYPETAMSSAQSATIDRLLDETDPSLRLKMFKGLWFQPPYTEHFETYFGLDGAEAAYVICMDTGTLSQELYTTERGEADQKEGGYQEWLQDPAAQARWQAAQKIRGQLLSCFNKPGSPWTTPVPPTLPPVAEKKCDYKSFEGNFDQGGLAQIEQLLSQGYKVAVEGNEMCSQISEVPGPESFTGAVKIVGYRCQ